MQKTDASLDLILLNFSGSRFRQVSPSHKFRAAQAKVEVVGKSRRIIGGCKKLVCM